MIMRGSVYSQVLEMDTGLAVVAPSIINDFAYSDVNANAKVNIGRNADTDGETVSSPFRSCYLLHGLCGNGANFLDFTLLPLYAKLHPAFYIMPEVSRSFYADMKRGQKFFTYVTEELPEICRRLFNISHRPEDTAVMGCSMGGYGALKCALRRPDQYGYAAAFAPAGLYLQEQLPDLRQPEGAARMCEAVGDHLFHDLQAIFGDGLEISGEDSIPDLAAQVADFPQKPRLLVTVGEGDYLLEENRRFQRHMANLPFDFTYAEAPGQHDWFFFDGALAKALAWWMEKSGEVKG